MELSEVRSITSRRREIMVNVQVALPILLVVALFVGVAFHARSLMLGSLGGMSIFGYVAVRSGDNLFLSYYILAMFFMTMGVAVYLTKTQMGDTR